MAQSNERRRTLVVNRELQQRIIFAVSLVPTIGLALACVIVAVFCRRLLGEAMRADAQLPSLVPLFLSLLGFVIVSAIVVVLQALRFSHRIAGPAYRLLKSMERLRSGDLAFRVHLRKGDHLVELADELNRVLDYLNEHPPRGATTGSDIVEVEADEPEPELELAGADAAGDTHPARG